MVKVAFLSPDPSAAVSDLIYLISILPWPHCHVEPGSVGPVATAAAAAAAAADATCSDATN